jgi:hypothetical protein
VLLAEFHQQATVVTVSRNLAERLSAGLQTGRRDLGTPGGGWSKIVLRGDLRVLSGVQGGFRHSGGGLDLS